MRPSMRMRRSCQAVLSRISPITTPAPPRPLRMQHGHAALRTILAPLAPKRRSKPPPPQPKRKARSEIWSADILGEIALPAQPTAIADDLESKEYDMYNFQDRLVPVSIEEDNSGGGEPVYQERTMISPPSTTTTTTTTTRTTGKFRSLIPPRATTQEPRIVHSEIARPDPDMGHPMRDLDTLDPDIKQVRHTFIKRLWSMTTKMKEPRKDDIDTLMESYLQLPSPRVCFLTRVQLRRLILNIGRCHNYQWFVYEHYATVICDMQANHTTVRLSEWTGLIDAIAKGYHFDKKTRLQKATEALSEMIRAGINPPDIIYISLVQAAVRARDWNMVQILDKELRDRRVDDHILVWTERFRIAGLLGDINQIHDLFREFSQKAIAVDIVFMNTVLAAFLGVDCPQVAELVYNRLRNHSLRKFGAGPYRRRRPTSLSVVRSHRRIFLTGIQIDELERTIERELRVRRIDEEQLYHSDGSPTSLHTAFSQWVENYLTPYSARLIPNRETLRVFISYHCHYTGRMGDIAYYLNECDLFGIYINYGIYTDLLHGFFVWHGPDSPWNEARLRRVFESVREGIYKEGERVRVTYALVLAAIRAFGKVCGGQGAREVWECLRPLMEINDNVRHREEEAKGWLEDLVRKFEVGEKLGPGMSGQDWKYRVGDWRISYS